MSLTHPPTPGDLAWESDVTRNLHIIKLDVMLIDTAIKASDTASMIKYFDLLDEDAQYSRQIAPLLKSHLRHSNSSCHSFGFFFNSANISANTILIHKI